MKELTIDALVEAIARAGAEAAQSGLAPMAVFDADHTLWRADLGDVAFQAALKERRFRAEAGPALAALLTKNGGATAGDPHADAKDLFERYVRDAAEEFDVIAAMVVCFAGYREAELVALGREIFDRELHAEVYEEIEPIFEACRKAKLEIRVISGTAHWLVVGAAERLGVGPAAVFGARAVVDGDRIGGTMKPPVTYREGKVDTLRGFMSARGIAAAFGDSLSDLGLLQHAGLKVGVNPRPGLVKALESTEGFVRHYPRATRGGALVTRLTTDRVIA